MASATTRMAISGLALTSLAAVFSVQVVSAAMIFDASPLSICLDFFCKLREMGKEYPTLENPDHASKNFGPHARTRYPHACYPTFMIDTPQRQSGIGSLSRMAATGRLDGRDIL
ncbi:MAG: hypothetical protein ACKVP2_01435 [Burkholderiales bacterium]